MGASLLFFWWGGKQGKPRKKQGFSLRRTPKILGKARIFFYKENLILKKARKSKKARVGGSGWWRGDESGRVGCS